MKTNLTNKTIELTKAEMKAAMNYGTSEYDMLQTIRRDYPNFKVVEIKSKKNKADFADLNMNTIRSYVLKHGSNEQKLTFAFISKKSIDEDGEYHEAQSFFQIKSWFLNEFSEVKQQRKDFRKKILDIYEAAAVKAVAEVA